MPSRFSAQFETVAMPMLETQFGVEVTYWAGYRSTETLTALVTDKEYESIELESGLPVKLVARDWLIPAASIVIDGEVVTPKAGHRIIEGDEEYEVVPIAGRPAVELQHGNYRYLLHSQRVTT
jgi:hypothetical protein